MISKDEAAAPGQGELSVLGIVNDNQVARFNPESGKYVKQKKKKKKKVHTCKR